MGVRPKTSRHSFFIAVNRSGSSVTPCQVMPSTCIVPPSVMAPPLGVHSLRVGRPQQQRVGPVLLLCQGWARFQRVEDDAGELPFEAADRFATALPLRLFALEVGASSGVHTCLRNRDSIEGGVELAVAAAVETVPLDAA